MPISGSRVLNVDGEAALQILKALGSDTRLLILSLLSHNVLNVSQLSEALDLPAATVAFNLKHLEEAGLIHVQSVPGSRGKQKLLAKRYDEVHIKLPGVAVGSATDTIEVSMPIGNYHRLSIQAPCGLMGDTTFIGRVDDVRSFYEPEHVFAQLLWLGQGFVEYEFPNNLPYGARATELELSAELCSEAPQYELDWPSDITLWVGGTEIGTWTSPSDFGGVRGKYTPAWWPEDQTMYGLLKTWRVTRDGSFIGEQRVSEVTLADLRVEEHTHITVRLGVKPDAANVGGMNLFGRRCGNHAQDFLMRLRYEFGKEGKPYKVK